METWKEHLRGYEIMLWDSSRFDVNSVLWVKQAVETELYAFAVDYIRHYAVYTHGGIYLDMDVEIVKPFDQLLDTDLLLAYTVDESSGIESGCFGAQKGHPYIKKCMEYYEQRPFFEEARRSEIMKVSRDKRFAFLRPILAPDLMSRVLSEDFLDKNYHVFGGEYFTARKAVSGEVIQTKNTYAVHHFASTYISKAARERRKFIYSLAHFLGEDNILVKFALKLRDIAWNFRRHL
jgi:hypothetical protein